MGLHKEAPVGSAGEPHPKRRYSPELIAETIEVWQPYYDEVLTDEAAREINESTTLFAAGLLEIRRDLPLPGRWSGDAD
jgi:hypothetical protein